MSELLNGEAGSQQRTVEIRAVILDSGYFDRGNTSIVEMEYRNKAAFGAAVSRQVEVTVSSRNGKLVEWRLLKMERFTPEVDVCFYQTHISNALLTGNFYNPFLGNLQFFSTTGLVVQPKPTFISPTRCG